MAIKSEAKLTTFEAISMIVGNSIGTGIIAVPYLATKNSMIDVIWMVDRNAAISDSYGSIDDSFCYRSINTTQLNI